MTEKLKSPVRHDILQVWLKNCMPAKPNALKKDDDIQKNPDPHIDQDFIGYPHGVADKKVINPKTTTEKKVAGVTRKKSRKTYSS